LESIKTAILDNDLNRKALYERFIVSQKYAQIDPWKERAEGAQAHEFNKIEISAA
jgi:nitrite reductase (NADH) large subunit